jgi:hypothetical protein
MLKTVRSASGAVGLSRTSRCWCRVSPPRSLATIFAGGCVDTRKKVKLGSALAAVARIIGRR